MDVLTGPAGVPRRRGAAVRSALVHGSTEAVLALRVLDTRSANPLADARVHWENGGTFVVKGVRTLPQDMRAALRSVLEPPPRP